MDYTKFLGKKEEVVLAYLGGAHVFGKDRRLRVDEPRPGLGFHRFEVRGRNARARGAADPGLDDLPRVSGHLASGFLFHGGGASGGVGRLALLPEEEPSPLAKARARRWWSGDLIFESLDFDTEVEDEARLRLERGEPIATLKGVPSTLRVAFGVALALDVARRLGVPLSVREVIASAVDVADRGAEAARELTARIERERRLEAERARARALMAGRPVAVPAASRARRGAPTAENAADRAEEALDGAGARMLSSRRVGNGNLEVAFDFMDTRFISVVDAITLQVWDSGVCLAGEDRLVTLDSLPGVIREAIESGSLVITRH